MPNFINNEIRSGEYKMFGKQLVKLSVCIIAASLLFACSSNPTHIAISDEVRNTQPSADVVLATSQKEIYADIMAANSSAVSVQFGLLGALIGAVVDASVNSGKSKTAEKKVAVVKDSLLDYDFNSELKNNLDQELQNISWLNIESLVEENGYDQTKLNSVFEASTSDAVFIVEAGYYLVPDFNHFKLSVNINAYAKNQDLKNLAALKVAALKDSEEEKSLLYRNNMVFISSLPISHESAELAAKAWAENEGQLIRRAMGNAVKEIKLMLTMDLNTNGDIYKKGSLDIEKKDIRTYSYIPSIKESASGRLIESNSDRVLLRTLTGELHSVPASMLIVD
jgi:hypothetical protein